MAVKHNLILPSSYVDNHLDRKSTKAMVVYWTDSRLLPNVREQNLQKGAVILEYKVV